MLTDHDHQLLDGANYLYLATINADGSPQVSPVWVETDGDLVVINTARGRLKERNVSRDPRVAVSIHDQANPYDNSSFKGKVVEITEDGAHEHIEKLSHKYTGKPYAWHQPGEQRVIIKIAKAAPKSATA
jgi:PPOX class probable F420-dependent enzyme